MPLALLFAMDAARSLRDLYAAYAFHYVSLIGRGLQYNPKQHMIAELASYGHRIPDTNGRLFRALVGAGQAV